MTHTTKAEKEQFLLICVGILAIRARCRPAHGRSGTTTNPAANCGS
jgi:hypothetical protein